MADAALLNVVLFLPLIGVALLIAVPAPHDNVVRRLSLTVMVAQFVLTALLYLRFDAAAEGLQFETRLPWIPAWGVYYQIGLDGYNVLLVLLTTFLGPLVVASAFTAITKDVKLFYAMVFVLQFTMLGTFVAQDLFLFYLFWEAMLIPMFLIIGIWGGERRIYATLKFVLYTAFGSILMLAAVIYLVYSLNATTGITSFAFADLYRAELPLSVQTILLAAFGLSFAIKVPIVPLHTWLPDAHVEAPTAGSVILAGVLLKMGTYGFMKLGFPLFPDATRAFAPLIMALAVVSIIYGACLAWVQTDIKKIIAYSSISHLGLRDARAHQPRSDRHPGRDHPDGEPRPRRRRAVPDGRHGLRALPHSRAGGLRRSREAAAGVRGVLRAADAGVDRACRRRVDSPANSWCFWVHSTPPGRSTSRVSRFRWRSASAPSPASSWARSTCCRSRSASCSARRRRPTSPFSISTSARSHPGLHRGRRVRARPVPRRAFAQDRAGRAAVPAAGGQPPHGDFGRAANRRRADVSRMSLRDRRRKRASGTAR